MTAYNRAHQLRIDGQSEAEANDRVAAITEQLVNERMESPRHVAEALDELAGTSDHNNSEGNTHFAANLAAALMGGREDELVFWHRLQQQVREYLARDASTDAAFRVAQEESEAAEAQDMARSRWAA